jgi:transcriptional regulator with XRE-family HTH domain
MGDGVTGIHGEYRRLSANEISLMVKSLRSLRGIKQRSLALESCVAERTLERLESGKTVHGETYRRVASALGLPADIFIKEQLVPTPEDAVRWMERDIAAVERDFLEVAISKAEDPRQIRAMFSQDCLWFDDSQVKATHLEQIADVHQNLSDWIDIASEVSELDKLAAAREILEAFRQIERLGYCVKVATLESYKTFGGLKFSMAIVVIFPTGTRLSKPPPEKILIPKNMVPA